MLTLTVSSPLGPLLLAAADGALTHVLLPTGTLAPFEEGASVSPSSENRAVLAQAHAQLSEYFEGRRTHFTVRLSPRGTAFQRSVWSALCEIPHGQTCSYVDIARRLGRPTASRAVGAANGQNPIAIIVPCHRVIGASGALTGYAGGLERKRWLLQHEGAERQLPLGA